MGYLVGVDNGNTRTSQQRTGSRATGGSVAYRVSLSDMFAVAGVGGGLV